MGNWKIVQIMMTLMCLLKEKQGGFDPLAEFVLKSLKKRSFGLKSADFVDSDQSFEDFGGDFDGFDGRYPKIDVIVGNFQNFVELRCLLCV